MENTKTKPDRKLIVAILLIAAGALLMLDTFDISTLPLRHYILNWKTLLIAIGVVIISTRERPIAGYILIGIGLVSWLPSFVNYSVSLSQVFWPAVLIGVGILIITRRGRHVHAHRHTSHCFPGNTTESVSDYIDDVSVFGGGTKVIQSQNFKGGDITAIFGGSEISFKEAKLSESGCIIDSFVMFGGTKLIVPDSWIVKSDVVSIFGGLNDKRAIRPDENQTEPAAVLHLKGSVIFGGIEIKSF